MCLQELHWLPIKYRTIFKLLIIVYNAFQGQASQCLKKKLKHKQFLRTMRQSTSLSITSDISFNKKTSFADRGFSYTAAKYQNDQPEYIRRSKDMKNFKSLLKNTLLHISIFNTIIHYIILHQCTSQNYFCDVL